MPTQTKPSVLTISEMTIGRSPTVCCAKSSSETMQLKFERCGCDSITRRIAACASAREIPGCRTSKLCKVRSMSRSILKACLRSARIFKVAAQFYYGNWRNTWSEWPRSCLWRVRETVLFVIKQLSFAIGVVNVEYNSTDPMTTSVQPSCVGPSLQSTPLKPHYTIDIWTVY